MSNPTQITPNLYVVDRGVNIYILKIGGNELALIDTGMPGSTKPVLNAISALGYQPSAIKHILVTHADIDHIGSLRGLVEATGAQVHAGAVSTPYITAAKAPSHGFWPMQLMMRPVSALIQKKAHVDHQLNDGDVVDIGGGIQVFYAPGHTEDNVCFFWPQEDVLFTPDLINRFSDFALTPALISWDIAKAKESAKRVLATDPAIICPGHGKCMIVAEEEEAYHKVIKSLST